MRSPPPAASLQCVLMRASICAPGAPCCGTSTIAREGWCTPRPISAWTTRSAAASSTTVTIRFRTDARACGSPFSVTSGSPPSSNPGGTSHNEARCPAMAWQVVSRSTHIGVARLSASPKSISRLWTACSSEAGGWTGIMAGATCGRRARAARRPLAGPTSRRRRSAAARPGPTSRPPGPGPGSPTPVRPRRRA